MPPKPKPPALATYPKDWNENMTDYQPVSAKSESGAIIGIVIGAIVISGSACFIRTRCIKKRENGWEIRKSTKKCMCWARPPRSELEGIKRRLEKQKNQS